MAETTEETKTDEAKRKEKKTQKAEMKNQKKNCFTQVSAETTFHHESFVL